MKTSIAILLLFIFTSPVFAQQEDAAETYTDTGMPAAEEGIGRPSGFHGILGAGLFTAKRIFGYNHRLINVGPVILMRRRNILASGASWDKRRTYSTGSL
jgi:hypothetical protein